MLPKGSVIWTNGLSRFECLQGCTDSILFAFMQVAFLQDDILLYRWHYSPIYIHS
jgi:hypothetical protein